jgi:adenine-specific DNA-methyltransferase
MKKVMRTPEDNRRAQLENEITRLNKKIAKYEAIELKQDRFGLVWLPIEEAFDDDVENKLPILEEVPKLAINSKDNKPTHLLIEGDNYHALTCLNYTHKGKVDVIYIDPPYNTGSDGFKYKDKRILDKYPDGTEVLRENPLRHSYWLSFMKKRLELSKDLLKDGGVIFISIDDNEVAQLKLLCDEIFGTENFIETIIWKKRATPPNDREIGRNHEYILCYGKTQNVDLNLLPRTEEGIARYKNSDNDPSGAWVASDLSANGKGGRLVQSLVFPIKNPFNKKEYLPPNDKCWLYNKEKIDKFVSEGRIIFRKSGAPFLKRYLSEVRQGQTAPTIWVDAGFSQDSAQEIKDLFNGENIFESPKPLKLIRRLCFLGCKKKDALILDFFAGSGTTGQAVMELNEEDKGNRRFILITNNDEITNGGKHKIMTDICYPRIKKVVNGYNSKNGLGNSMRYFKTAFVGKNNILRADDADKIELAHNAGGMLAIAEDTFDQVEETNYWQIFEGAKQYTAVYFREEFIQYDEFEKKVKSLKKPVVVYIFSWEKELEFSEFENERNITVKTIPQPILEIYKQIYNLV